MCARHVFLAGLMLAGTATVAVAEAPRQDDVKYAMNCVYNDKARDGAHANDGREMAPDPAARQWTTGERGRVYNLGLSTKLAEQDGKRQVAGWKETRIVRSSEGMVVHAKPSAQARGDCHQLPDGRFQQKDPKSHL